MTLIGHNGAGKSTLIKYILRLYPSAKNHKYLPDLSQNVTQICDMQKVGYAPELGSLNKNCNAQDYINLITQNKTINDFAEIADTLNFNIDKTLKIANYSKGMEQLLSLVLAFTGKPDIVILDEPTSGLDPFVSAKVQEFIIAQKQNTKLIISTHSLEFAFNIKNEILIIKQGKILQKKFYTCINELKEDFFKAKP